MLLKNGRYDNAYYFVGIALECALKACIARRTNRHDFPDKQIVIDSWTHNLSKLVKTANLDAFLSSKMNSEPPFARNWLVVKDLDVDSRYEFHSRRDALDFYQAATKRTTGVMNWIRENW